MVRRGVRDMLETAPDILVVGEASTAAEALATVPALAPDVAVLDVRLPDGDGVSVCRDLRSQLPDLACLMLTSFADDEALYDAIMAGASGYVLKQIRGADLVNAIRTVAGGQSMLDAGTTAQVMERLRTGSRTEDPLSSLTEQERRILDLIGEGPHEPADRRAFVPRGKDSQELRIEPTREIGAATTHAGSCHGEQSARSSRHALSATTCAPCVEMPTK